MSSQPALEARNCSSKSLVCPSQESSSWRNALMTSIATSLPTSGLTDGTLGFEMSVMKKGCCCCYHQCCCCYCCWSWLRRNFCCSCLLQWHEGAHQVVGADQLAWLALHPLLLWPWASVCVVFFFLYGGSSCHLGQQLIVARNTHALQIPLGEIWWHFDALSECCMLLARLLERSSSDIISHEVPPSHSPQHKSLCSERLERGVLEW